MPPLVRSVLLFFSFALVFCGCGQKVPTQKETREKFVAIIETSYNQIAEQIAGGNIPGNSGKLSRAAHLLEKRTAGTPFAEDGAAINKQVDEIEKLLTGKDKPTREKLQPLLDKLKASIDALKTKESQG